MTLQCNGFFDTFDFPPVVVIPVKALQFTLIVKELRVHSVI